MALSIYLKVFDPKTGYEIRNRFPNSLAESQKNSTNIENNRKFVGMIDKRDNIRIPQNLNNYQNR